MDEKKNNPFYSSIDTHFIWRSIINAKMKNFLLLYPPENGPIYLHFKCHTIPSIIFKEKGESK